mmetsp:Transcript_28221/g.39255  ORF Transcript_28221/g.39255 Transcript_28221/m.39255 type:complete len:207 (-) Transcript_28221:339-959(-)
MSTQTQRSNTTLHTPCLRVSEDYLTGLDSIDLSRVTEIKSSRSMDYVARQDLSLSSKRRREIEILFTERKKEKQQAKLNIGAQVAKMMSWGDDILETCASDKKRRTSINGSSRTGSPAMDKFSEEEDTRDEIQGFVKPPMAFRRPFMRASRHTFRRSRASNMFLNSAVSLPCIPGHLLQNSSESSISLPLVPDRVGHSEQRPTVQT